MSSEKQSSLKAEFEKRNPWITRFHIENEEYGGFFDAMNDVRIEQFFECFPSVENILELGSLEGGHSFALAQNSAVKKVTAIEGRADNIQRAEFVKEVLDDKKVEFLEANIEKTDFDALGKFDAVFCSGLLYHLPEPWKLIEQLGKISPNIFIWTQVSEEVKAKKIRNGWRGKYYREGGFFDPLSGLSKKSFWFSLGSLVNLLTINGYSKIRIIENNLNHPKGPAVTIAATKDVFEKSIAKDK